MVIQSEAGSSMGGAAAVAKFAYQTSCSDLPAAVLARSRWALADTLGVALAGRWTRAATAAEQMAHAESGTAQLLGSNRTSSAVMAALANGIAASALDFDDGHYLGGGIHPGAPVIATLLAVSSPTTTWSELLGAQTVGYEVAIRAGALLAPTTPTSEYHTSGTAGALGAAVAAAKLLGLNEEGILRALRIASAHAPVARFQLSMAKESIGWAAATAVVAARLAAAGFEDAGVSVDTVPVLGGFPPTAFDDSKLSMPLGTQWETLATYVKPYACCRAIHAALDGLLGIMKREKLAASDLDRVVVSTIGGGRGLDFVAPPTLEHAQYSFPFAVGAAAVFGQLGANEMVEATLVDSRVADIARRVVIEHDPDLDGPVAGNYPAGVGVKGPRGSVSEVVSHARGSDRAPLNEVELGSKFRMSAMVSMSAERADALLASTLESSLDSELGMFHRMLGA